MAGTPAILEFDLEPGQSIDAIIAAKALIEWAQAIKQATRVIDPGGSVTIDLLSADPACLRFSTILHFIEENVFGSVEGTLDPYPRIKHFLAMNVLILPGAVVGGLAVAWATSADPQTAEKQEAVAQSPVVRQHVENFYRTVQGDKSIRRVIVRETPSSPPVLSVDRSEFAERSGLWVAQEEGPHERDAGGEWNVVVTHPVALARPLIWKFMRDGLPFKAKMADKRFLAAIKDGTLPLNVQEGVTMTVHVSYRERREGQIWVPIKGTYVIERVISPSASG